MKKAVLVIDIPDGIDAKKARISSLTFCEQMSPYAQRLSTYECSYALRPTIKQRLENFKRRILNNEKSTIGD